MSESVGGIHYQVSADTSQLLSESAKAKTWLDRLVGLFGRADAASAKTERQMTQTARAVRQLADEASRTSPPLLTLNKLLAGIITARTVQAVIQMSDQYGQMASRIRNATSNTAEYEMVQARLLKTANGTYRALSEAQEVYLSVSDTLRSLGYSTAEVLDISDSLSYAFVRDAARSDQARTAMDAYSKALMKGKVEADGWASLMAATPSLVKGIAGATGESEEKIRKLGATGKLSLQALNEGLRQSLDENKRMADEMTVSVQDAGTKLRNALQLFIGKVNESSGASKGLTDNVSLLADALQDPETIKAAQELANGVVTAFGWIITSAKDVVKFVKWMSEEAAAAMTGVADDDITRLEKKAEMLRLKLGARQGFLWGLGAGDVKKELDQTEAQIAAFYKRQADREKQRRQEDRGFVPSAAGGGGGPPKKVTAEAVDEAEAKKAAEKRRKLAEEAAQAIVDVEEQASKDASEAWTYWEKQQVDAYQERADAFKLQWQQVFQFIDDEQERAIDEGKAFLKETKNVGDEVALIFSSAAGEAITHWQGVRGLLQGVLADLAQIAVREAVTKPLSNLLTTSLASFLPKFANGSDYVPRDMAAIVHKGERIVPAAENLRGGSGGFDGAGSIIVNYGGLSVGAGVSRNEMAAAMEFTRQKTIADISEARRRGFQTGG